MMMMMMMMMMMKNKNKKRRRRRRQILSIILRRRRRRRRGGGGGGGGEGGGGEGGGGGVGRRRRRTRRTLDIQRKKWTDSIAGWAGRSFATTQALAHDCQRSRQGRALPRPKPLPMTVRGDRGELCHDPSPCP